MIIDMSYGADEDLWVARLRAATQNGTILDLSAGAPAAHHTPAAVEAWSADRTIPATAIRQVLIGPHTGFDPRGLRIRGARITGTPDFAYVEFEFPLHLLRCFIDRDLDMSSSKLSEVAVLGCHTNSILLDNAALAGDLLAEGLNADGEVRAPGAKIAGQLNLTDAILRNPDGNALILDNATMAAVHATGLVATGTVRAPGAKIAGQLNLTDAILRNPDGNALILDNATMAGELFVNGLDAAGVVRAIGARINGPLILTNAILRNPGGNALVLDNATVVGGLFADDLTAVGVMRAPGARIEGQLHLTKAILRNPGGDALNLDNVTVVGDLGAHALYATGHVHASGARIEGQLNLTGAILRNPGGDALNLGSTTVVGGVFAHGMDVIGEVGAFAARIDGQFDLTGAILRNPGGNALVLDYATMVDVLLDRLEALGEVRALGARVDGRLSLRDTTIDNGDGMALVMDKARIGALELRCKQISGIVHLGRAKIGDLTTPSNRPPVGSLFATGWELGDVQGSIRNDRRAAEQWLSTALPGEGFTAQPWHELAAVYDRNGHPAEARRLRFNAANEVTKQAPPWSKVMRSGYRMVVGHGYYPLRAAVWLFIVLFLGVGLVSATREYFIPTDPAAAKSSVVAFAAANSRSAPDEINADEPCELYPDYPCLDSFNYALTNVIPAATSTMRPDWSIRANAPLLLTLALPTLRILAWILTALLLAGVTGLLRKT